MIEPNCEECRAIAEEYREAVRESVSKPDFKERWAKFKEMLRPGGDDLPINGMKDDPAATSPGKAYIVIMKMNAHYVKTGHKPFWKT